MGQVSSKLRRYTTGYTHWCPACEETHILPDTWTFVNGNLEAPSFSPSFRITSGHFAPGWKEGDKCWCTYAAEHPDVSPSFSCKVCHYILTDGILNFCGDCTHALAGQAVALPVLPEHHRDA